MLLQEAFSPQISLYTQYNLTIILVLLINNGSNALYIGAVYNFSLRIQLTTNYLPVSRITYFGMVIASKSPLRAWLYKTLLSTVGVA